MMSPSTLIIKHIKNKTVSDALALYSGRSIGLIVGLCSTIVYGTVFVNTQIAIISLFEMILNLFLSLGFTWSTIAITRFGKEEIQKLNSLNNTSSIRIGIVVPLLLISITSILIFQNHLLSYIGTSDPTIIIILIIDLVLSVLHEHLSYILTTVEKHKDNVYFQLAQSIGRITILSIFYFKLSNEVSAELYLKLNVYLLLGLFIIRVRFVDLKLMFPLTAGKTQDYLKFIRYVLPQIYGFGGLYIINWVDVYFIRKYMNLYNVGSYQFLYSIFLKLSSFAIILNTLFFPRVIFWKMSDSTALQRYLRNGPLFVLTATMVGSLIFLLVYKKIFGLFFDTKFLTAYAAFNLLILSLPFYFASFMFIPILNGFDNVKYIQIVSLIAAALNVAIDYFFIKRFGLIAAAVGTFVAYYATYMLLATRVQKMFKLNYSLLNTMGASFFILVLGSLFL